MRSLLNEMYAETVILQSIYSPSGLVLTSQKQPTGKLGPKHHVTPHAKRQNTMLKTERLHLLVEMRKLATGAHGGPGFRSTDLNIAKHSYRNQFRP